MKTQIRFYAGMLAAAASVWATLPAADAQPPQQTGHILLLENEGVVEGTIAKEGDKYRIQRQAGETVVPGTNVLRLCDTMDEAYAFLRARANLRDADERIRLARWCHLHGLRPQAVAEAAAAVELRPQNAEGHRLLQNFQKTTAVAGPGAPAPRPEGMLPAAAISSAPAIEVNAEALGQFITKVQPVLMNTCVSCHQSGQGGAFKLTRALEGGVLNRRATQQNLTAVLEQIDRDHPDASALLIKAAAIHGSASHPPLKSRQTPAYRNLKEWVKATLASNPLLAERAAALTTVAALPDLKPVPEPGKAKAEPSSGENVSASRPAAPVEAGPGPQAAASPPSPKPAGPLDPYDPIIFNQQARPEGR